MAWRDQYHYKHYVYIPPAEIVYQSEIVAQSFSAEGGAVYHIGCEDVAILQGDFSNVTPGMLLWVGSEPGKHDRGQTFVMSTATGTQDNIYMWNPYNLHMGEVAPARGDFVTILNDYRIFMRPPYAVDGNYYYNGGDSTTRVVQGAVYDQYPMANGGPGYCNICDDTTGVITVDFDAALSYAVADDAQLGGLTADLFGGAYTLTASNGTPANAVDGNTATYWEVTATSTDAEWMQVDWGDGNDVAIRQMTLTGSSTYGARHFALQWSDDTYYWVSALFVQSEAAYGTNEQRTYDIHYAGEHRYWRLLVWTPNPTRIEEWELFAEDRTAGTSPYTWDVQDGTITVGSSTTEAITATFPRGFRWISLTVTDTNANAGVHYIPVGAVTVAHDIIGEMSYAGATITASSELSASYQDDYAFDNDDNTRWLNDGDTGWIQIQFTAAVAVTSYGLNEFNMGTSVPDSVTIKGSNNGVDFDTLDTRTGLTWATTYQTFDVTTPGYYTYYRAEVVSSGIYVGMREWDLFRGQLQSEGLIESVEVLSHTLEPMGQTIEYAIHDALPVETVTAGVYDEWSYAGATITASTNLATYDPEDAFDNNTATHWVTATSMDTGWLQIQFASAQKISGYSITHYNSPVTNVFFTPNTWTLQGSATGVYWDILDSQSGVSAWADGETKYYDLASHVSYVFYRIDITLNNGGSKVGITELNLYKQTETVAPHYPNGGLVMAFEREWYDLTEGVLSAAGVTDREHMRFVGWMDEERTSIEGDDDTVSESFAITCRDAGQKLNQLVDFTFMAQKDAAPALGYEMKHANMDTYFYLMVRWLSTAANLSDFLWSYTADHYNIGLLGAQGSSIYDMIQQRALGIDFMFTCNKNGQLKIIPDLRTCAQEFRQNAATAETLTAADYRLLDYGYTETAIYHWVYGSGVGFSAHDADSGSFAVTPYFTLTPGQAPGQGVGSETEGERLAAYSDPGSTSGVLTLGTTSIHERLGRSFAQKATERSILSLELVHAGDTGLDPAEADILYLTLPATVSTLRSRPLTAIPGIIRRLDIEHDHESMTKTITLEWEEILSNYLAAWEFEPT